MSNDLAHGGISETRLLVEVEQLRAVERTLKSVIRQVEVLAYNVADNANGKLGPPCLPPCPENGFVRNETTVYVAQQLTKLMRALRGSPADDDEPVTEERLSSLGLVKADCWWVIVYDTETMEQSRHDVYTMPDHSWGIYRDSDEKWRLTFREDRPLSITREFQQVGDVRRLLSVLGL